MRKHQGVVTGPVSEPVGEVVLSITGNDDAIWAHFMRDGTDEVEIPSGSYILEVLVSDVPDWEFVGWYDGDGGMTTDPDQKIEMVVETIDVDDVDFMLSKYPDDLLCASGTFRPRKTRHCLRDSSSHER